MNDVAFVVRSRRTLKRRNGMFRFNEFEYHGIAVSQSAAVLHTIRITQEKNVNNSRIAVSDLSDDKHGGRMTFLIDKVNPNEWYDVWFESLPLLEES